MTFKESYKGFTYCRNFCGNHVNTCIILNWPIKEELLRIFLWVYKNPFQLSAACNHVCVPEWVESRLNLLEFTSSSSWSSLNLKDSKFRYANVLKFLEFVHCKLWKIAACHVEVTSLWSTGDLKWRVFFIFFTRRFFDLLRNLWNIIQAIICSCLCTISVKKWIISSFV